MESMGYRLEMRAHSSGHSVMLTLSLSRRENSDLFLMGDAMISWPTEGLQDDGETVLARSGIFVSEIASKPRGLSLLYATAEQARRTSLLLCRQLDQIGIAQEG